MRRCYLVCYDVRNAKRLRRVHKILKGYGEPWQFSVFYCVLKNIDRVRLQSDLESVMNLKEDQTLILDLGTDDASVRDGIVTVGPSMQETRETVVVI